MMDTRVPALLEMFASACPHRITPQRNSILVSLTQGMPFDRDDRGEFLSITPVTVSLHAPRWDKTDYALVWRADVDGLWAQCTLLGPTGVVLSTFKWEDPS
jgi:hypothetical protein